jgi:AbrB family transcriptional regulator (stage V sporulation protein T)
MRTTGIVRRIDDLGRVIIPKEIRRTLRLREGDPMEIFTDKDGEVILKKYSPIGELGDFAQSYADSLFKTIGIPCFVSDRDTIIAVSGLSKRDYLAKSISPILERIIDDRKLFKSTVGEKIDIINGQSSSFWVSIIYPIITEGDPVGAIGFVNMDINTVMGETESKLAQSAAGFLGKQMED